MAAPVFDATAITAITAGTLDTMSLSWTHTAGSGANNCGIVAVFCGNGGSQHFVPTGTPTASIGATNLTYLGSVLMGNVDIAGFIAVWTALGVPTGAQTVSTSITDTTQQGGFFYGTSFTYTGVGVIGALHTAFQTNGATATDAVTVPSATGHLVWGGIGTFLSATYSGESYTSRQYVPSSNPSFECGDQAGSASVNFTATQNGTNAAAEVGLDLAPPVVSTPAPYFNQTLRRASLY